MRRLLQNHAQQALWKGESVRLIATAGEYQDQEKARRQT
jgi:hypothetical protein